MKTIHARTRQSGFLDLGLGLLLLAIFGGASWGMVSAENKKKETEAIQQPQSSAESTYVGRQTNPELPER